MQSDRRVWALAAFALVAMSTLAYGSYGRFVRVERYPFYYEYRTTEPAYQHTYRRYPRIAENRPRSYRTRHARRARSTLIGERFGGAMVASWYDTGRLRADGHRFDPEDAHSCAHKNLPFGTRLLVENPRNGRQLVCVVRDRGPYIRGRQLDLSRAGARVLQFMRQGVALLRVSLLS